MKNRNVNWHAVVVALLALVYFIIHEWVGITIPEFDRFTLLIVGLLVAFGINR